MVNLSAVCPVHQEVVTKVRLPFFCIGFEYCAKKCHFLPRAFGGLAELQPWADLVSRQIAFLCYKKPDAWPPARHHIHCINSSELITIDWIVPSYSIQQMDFYFGPQFDPIKKGGFPQQRSDIFLFDIKYSTVCGFWRPSIILWRYLVSCAVWTNANKCLFWPQPDVTDASSTLNGH